MKVLEDYISVSCNVHPTCCDLVGSLLCFGSCNSVAVCDFEDKSKIRETVVGHKDKVNCVKWVRCSSGLPEYLVSCSKDKCIVVWKMVEGRLHLLQSTLAHNDSITCLDTIITQQGSLLIVTTSVDGSTKVWCRDLKDEASETCLMDDLKTRGSLLMSLSCVQLKGGEVLVACGAEDSMIHLFISPGHHIKFTYSSALKGHTDWVRDLSFNQGKSLNSDTDCMLASAGQDGYVRLWSVCLTADKSLEVELSSVLAAHDGWVQSVQWLHNRDNTRGLLTSSLDHSVVLWSQHGQKDVWVEEAKFCEGDAVMRAMSSRDLLVSHNYTGAFQVWRNVETGWKMVEGCGGHLAGVSDVCWNPGGEFLLSIGEDKTTRLHACVVEHGCDDGGDGDVRGVMKNDGVLKTDIKNKENSENIGKNTNVATKLHTEDNKHWGQISRPQIHGYRINAVAAVSRFSFASGSDEKMVRVFSAPSPFLHSYVALCRALVSQIEDTGVATLPALALSNKVVKASEVPELDWRDGAPSEEWLRSALWLEKEKLYGHNFEMHSLTSCPSRCLLASASKASNADAASILLWSTTSWTVLQSLQAHSSTVTQLSFSHNGKHLLSVSKDRNWAMFTLADDNLKYMRSQVGQGHSRVIWACSWSHDDLHFATASRDKKVMVWGQGENGWIKTTEVFTAKEAVTAVDFAPYMVEDRYLVVVGLESGKIMLLSWTQNNQPPQQSFSIITTIDHDRAHHKAVKRVCFREGLKNSLQFASCAEDGAVKIHSIHLV